MAKSPRLLIMLFVCLLLQAGLARAEVAQSEPVLMTPASSSRPAGNADIVGLWYTENREGGVELYDCGNRICGKFYWFGDEMMNGSPADGPRDVHNFDPDKRQRPLCQMQFMSGFVPDGKGHYNHGEIYSPRHGQSFTADITIVDHDTLKLHGYVLTPLLGASQTWKRAADLPACNDG